MIVDKINVEGQRILQKSTAAANQLGIKIYLVGGTVRDLLLNKESLDFDLAVEGNAIEFAQFLSPSLGGEVKKYEDFLSATIILPSKKQIDIATTRTEIYSAYGELPVIKSSDIMTDLHRRDFSINAIAIKLNSTNGEEIIDPYNGVRDIESGLIKILYEESFMDDPTRIFRAARFMHRLKFNLEPNTSILLAKSSKYVADLSNNRIKVELQKIIEEGSTLKVLRQLNTWGVTKLFLPGVNFNNISIRNIDFIKNWCANRSDIDVYLVIMMLIYWQTLDELHLQKIKLIETKKEIKCIDWLYTQRNNIQRLLNNKQTSFLQMHRMMYNMPEEAEIFLLSILGKNKYDLLTDIKLARKGVQLPLNGKDVLKKGFSPGPVIGEILSQLEIEVLRGNLVNRDEALKWLKKVREDYAK